MKTSIFVIEDDPDIAGLVRHHLETAGFAVRIFSTGHQVIAESERQRPAVFLLDIMVPGKDGLELCRQIRGRLHRQTLQPARTGGAGEGSAATLRAAALEIHGPGGKH